MCKHLNICILHSGVANLYVLNAYIFIINICMLYIKRGYECLKLLSPFLIIFLLVSMMILSNDTARTNIKDNWKEKYYSLTGKSIQDNWRV